MLAVIVTMCEGFAREETEACRRTSFAELQTWGTPSACAHPPGPTLLRAGSWLWFRLQSYRMGQCGLQDHFTLRSLEAVILTCVFWHLARQSDLEINVKRKLTEGQGKQRWGIHPQRHFVPPGTMPQSRGSFAGNRQSLACSWKTQGRIWGQVSTWQSLPVSLLGLLALGVTWEAALMLLAPLMWFWSPQARTQLQGNRCKQGLVWQSQ